MKSRTSFCNRTLLKKDLTRFAPLWGLYLVGHLLGMLLMLDSDRDYWFVYNLADLLQAMCAINLCYAMVTTQLLFGDLYNSRMCNALHALPMRRECWFGTHVVAGMLFSLIPTAVITALYIPFTAGSIVVNGWQVPLYWFAGVNLEYVFFFGLAVLSMLCAGNRMGAILVYGIVNFASYIVYFLVDTVYIPMLHGVVTQGDIFELLCPVVYLVSRPLVDVNRKQEFLRVNAEGAEVYETYADYTVLVQNWIYLAVMVVIGILLLVLALRMYKKRQLECAGDLMATRKLEPVFMVLYSLVAAAMFQVVNALFAGDDFLLYPFLLAGLAVGWFTGRMLVERRVQVFRRSRNWLGFAALALALGLSLFITKLDPLGIEDWTPAAEDVKIVYISAGYRGEAELTELEEIEDALRLHQMLLEEKLTQEQISAEEYDFVPEAAEITTPSVTGVTVDVQAQDALFRNYRDSTSVTLTYVLKNGRRVERQYRAWVDSPQGQIIKGYVSSVEAVFSNYSFIDTADDLIGLAEDPEYFHVNGYIMSEEFQTKEAVTELLQAVVADCEAGNMAQYSQFHNEPVFVADLSKGLYEYAFWVSIGFDDCSINFDLYGDCENTLAWLETTGILETIREDLLKQWESTYIG